MKYVVCTVLLSVILMGCGTSPNATILTQSAPQLPAPNQNDIVSIIDPCGDAVGIIDEVLLKLRDGSILCLFTDNLHGDNPRFGLLLPGNYMTSDGSNCHFTINTDLNITY